MISTGMARVLDTIPAFEAFARKAFLESPVVRDQLWAERYEGAHPEVFEAFYARMPSRDGRAALVADLSRVRQRVHEAAPVVAGLVDQVEPAVAGAMGLPGSPAPGHVLMVGPMSTDALVGRLDGEVTLFHCLEWFTSAEGARILVAHEDAHAYHEMALGDALPSPPPEDPAWTAFSEGLALCVSEAAVPGRPEQDYYWYGHEAFADWLPWCQEHADELLGQFGEAVDEPGATERFFGGGLVEGRWRVGFFVAHRLVQAAGRPLPELVAMSPDEGRALVRGGLAAR